MLRKSLHIAKFIATQPNDLFPHGTKVFVDMRRNGHTELRPLQQDDGSEIPFRVVRTGEKLARENYDVVEEKEDFTVLIPIGARVKHAKYLFATGDRQKMVSAIAQIKELVLRSRRAAENYDLPPRWHEAMSALTNFCNTSDQKNGDEAFRLFKAMLHTEGISRLKRSHPLRQAMADSGQSILYKCKA